MSLPRKATLKAIIVLKITSLRVERSKEIKRMPNLERKTTRKNP
jgi:hypothetical protein